MDTATEAAFKKAGIDWLLSVGEVCGGRWETHQALTILADQGVDYEQSDQVDFSAVAVEPGDSFTDATYAEAVSARIVPNGSSRWDGSIEFFVSPSDWNNLVLGAIIRGVVTAGTGGESAWRARITA